MDPASFSFAVIGMFLTCCKGYNILSDAYRAPSDAQDAARRVRIEGAVLAGWGEHFEIRQDLKEQQKDEKLRIYLMRGQTLHGVFDALCAISETFTDTRRLDMKYGVIFDYHRKGDRSPRISRDVQDLLDGRDRSRSPSPGELRRVDKMERKLRNYKTKMSLLEKCRWSLRGKDRVHNLIRDLRRYNDDLIRLCSWEAQSQINRGLPTLTLPHSKNFLDLHLMADAAEEAAQDKASPMVEGRRRIAEMARFKARVMTPFKVSNRFQARWRLLDQKDYVLLSTSGPSTLAASLRGQELVFVEWKSYLGNNHRADKLAEEQIHKLGDFLSVPHRPRDFRTLDCIGLFKDKSQDRYGVVYHLPDHLRNIPESTGSENRRIFKPSSLTDLIDNVDEVLDLGIRFNIAKKLMYSVIVLHTCGWQHKNIRPDNILFFSARPAASEKVKDYRKDIGRPFIMGYGLSRPDDIVAEQPEVHRQQREHPETPSRRLEQFELRKARVSRTDDGGSDDDDKKVSLNIYQHPDKIANPSRRFRHSFDIYSLGLVLLEIGLWQNLQKFDPGLWKDAYGFQKFVLTRLVPDLWGQCGSIYGGVVKECLTMKSNDLELADERHRRLAWSIAERLDMCVA